MSNIKLDRAIAEMVFGKKIIGEVTCVNPPDGCWDAYPGTKPKSWHCRAERRPVFCRDRCRCKSMRRRKLWRDEWERDQKKGAIFKGHFSICLGVVLPYSDTLDYALELPKALKPAKFEVTWRNGCWQAVFDDAPPGSVKGEIGDTAAMAGAIATAALSHVWNDKAKQMAESA